MRAKGFDPPIPCRECSLVVAKDSWRPPFTGEDQIRIPVAIKITEDGAAHQPGASELGGIGIVWCEPIPCPTEHERGGRLGPPPTDNPPANKQIQLAVTVDVRQRQRPGA